MANILVCDDDKEIVDAIEIYLLQEGHQIFKAYDGEQAIKILKQTTIHLLIMDIMMPKLDGLQVLTRLREGGVSTPVMLLTARGEKEDVLTGVYHKLYFEEQMQRLDDLSVAPVAVVNANINDWKFVNDHFGDAESDRLIRTIADLIKQEAKPDYVIGRVDGDVFIILIPMAESEEAEEYCARVQKACLDFADPILAPSVACGVVYKTNVEEHLKEKLPDAEYEMFNNKFEIKNAPGYRERLEHGVS